MIKALIVDDEKIVRKGLISMMPWEKYSIKIVGEAASGEKALEFLAENNIELLITDISMPKMTGIDLIKEVYYKYPKINVVILTCHMDFSFLQECLRLGILDYIIKTELEDEKMDMVLNRISQKILKNGSHEKEEKEHFLNSSNYSEEIVLAINDAQEYIRDNLSGRLNENEIAKKVNISRSYFSICFKKIVQKSFTEYIRDEKMQKAKELMLNTNEAVYKIALRLGFEDEKYFSRIFKKYIGQLPSEYRKGVIKKNDEK